MQKISFFACKQFDSMKIKIFICGVIMISALYWAQKNSLPTLVALKGNLTYGSEN